MNGTVVFRDPNIGVIIAMIPLAETNKIRECDIAFPNATREIIRFW